ncbi:MAG: Fe-S cluster assembly protein SufD [Candidatus Tectimicrobiota bacterium]|nr:MAG: Fe-S cluster assembly protein SufD [Candidatus Tectomicrobia bacterium]
MTVETLQQWSAEAVEALSAAKAEPSWMRERRLAAWRCFEELAWPSGTEEEWRRTDLRGLHLEAYAPLPPVPPARQEEVPAVLQPHLALPETALGGLLLQQDGVPLRCELEPELRRQGVVFCPLEAAVQEYPELVAPYFMTQAVPAAMSKFTALHGALWQGGVFLYVPRGVQVALPLRALTVHGRAASLQQAHVLLVADEQAQVTFIEEQLSCAEDLPGLYNGVVEIFTQRGAQVTVLQIQNWSRRLWGFAYQRALLAEDSHLRWAVAGLGSRLHWTSLGVVLRGRGSSSRLFGLTLTDGRQHLDYQTLQDHQAPHTESDLLFKSALLGRSRTVFRGVIWLRPQAQHTNAYQADHSLLLSPHARADSLPILEIEADDVRCKHGSTTGRIDDEQLFYLMSRGLSAQEAQRMIVEGFLETVIAEFPVAGCQERLRQLVAARI